MPNLISYSIKSRPSCCLCEAISETSMQLNSIICVKSICLQALIIYVVCHHLVCHWLGLLGLHFLRFTPTRAQAPGWLYKLWHTFLSITNLWVAAYLNSAFCIWLKWMCFPLGRSLDIFFILSCCQVANSYSLSWTLQVFFKACERNGAHWASIVSTVLDCTRKCLARVFLSGRIIKNMAWMCWLLQLIGLSAGLTTVSLCRLAKGCNVPASSVGSCRRGLTEKLTLLQITFNRSWIVFFLFLVCAKCCEKLSWEWAQKCICTPWHGMITL